MTTPPSTKARRCRRPRRGAQFGRLTVALGLLASASWFVLTDAAGAQASPAGPAASTPARTHRVMLNEQAALAARRVITNPLADSVENLTYGGGEHGIGITTGKERVYLVFWGTQWGSSGTDANHYVTFSNDAAGLAVRLQQLFKGLGTNSELWSGVMTQYCEGVAVGAQTCPTSSIHVPYPDGGALAGVWYDNTAAAPASATDLQLGQEAVAAASHFGNTNAILNRSAQYFVVSPSGTRPSGFPTGDWCSWHDWNGHVGAASSVGDIAFTNMPYILDATGCGANFVNSGPAGRLDGVSMVAGHEYAETITDQNPSGGWAADDGENADKCAWIASGAGAAANVAFATGSFAMQSTWANDANAGNGGCVLSHPIIGSDPFTIGYAWNYRASQDGCYQLLPYFSYNSRGAVNSICRSSVGFYAVHFANLASPGGNVQVSGYGSSTTPVNCKASLWIASGSEEVVLVSCYSFSGAPQDAYFTVSFTAGGGSGNTIAYAFADRPTAASYTPNPTYQYNSHGALATITRSGAGLYTVNFPDYLGPAAAGNVKITAYGSGAGYCKAGGWWPLGSSQQVSVNCYNTSGAATDQYFSVVYVNNINYLGDNLTADAYVWADQPTAAHYTPNLAYQRDTTLYSTGTVTITRAGTGSYDVFLPHQDQGLDGGTVQVTAGLGSGRCQIGSWGYISGGRTVRVYCFATSGTLTDNRFALQYSARLQ